VVIVCLMEIIIGNKEVVGLWKSLMKRQMKGDRCARATIVVPVAVDDSILTL